MLLSEPLARGYAARICPNTIFALRITYMICCPDGRVDKASDFGSKGPEFEPHKNPGIFSEQKINGTLLLSTQVYKWVL